MLDGSLDCAYCLDAAEQAALLLVALLMLNLAAYSPSSFRQQMSISLTSRTHPSRLQQLLQLTKPRVVSLIVFTAVIGMFLAVPAERLTSPVFWFVVLFATLGIALVAGSAAAVNCLVEQKIDAKMARTRARPLPMGTITSLETLLFAGVGVVSD